MYNGVLINHRQAGHMHFMDPRYELIVHEQEWEEHTSWYIMDKYGDGMVRVTVFNDNPTEAIISDLFVVEDMRKQRLGNYLLKFVKYCVCDYNESYDDFLKCAAVAANDISAHMFEQFGFIKEKDGRYILYP